MAATIIFCGPIKVPLLHKLFASSPFLISIVGFEELALSLYYSDDSCIILGRRENI
jgi:hypothetical protein